MCFKKAKPPEKSAEDVALEKELEAARANRKRELGEELKDEKEKRTREAIARAMGMFGGRSLIAGPKGGAGFLGFGGGRVTGSGSIIPRSPGGGGGGGGAPIMGSPGGGYAIGGLDSGGGIVTGTYSKMLQKNVSTQ